MKNNYNQKKLSREQIKLEQVNLLVKFDNFCKKNNLKYSICFGTLLGAIRHHGFIPWDDDIDVVMPYDDYQKLLQLVKQASIGENTKFSDPSIDNSVYPFGKLYATNTTTICDDSPFHDGIWIDVFPIYHVSQDDSKNQKILNKIYRYKKIMLMKLIGKGHGNKIKNIIKHIIKLLLLPIPIRYFRNKIIKLAEKQNAMFFNSEFSSCLTWGAYGLREIMNYDMLFNNLTLYKFEDVQVIGFVDYDYCLANLYKNYMELPPEDKRMYHGFDAYYVK